ncbi:MAG: SDR family oxidoreductase [Rubrivivax sp.]
MSTPLAFITGASSGIGLALAEQYARRGWRLALVARRGELVQAWADEAGLGPDRVRVYTADVADAASIEAAGRACIEGFGLPDLVVANAGISVGMDTRERQDLEVMRDTLAVNVVGVAATFHPFVQAMAARGRGTLVAVASVAAVRGLPGHGAYCASKAAVVAYCESLRSECRPAGVRVLCLLPGFVATPLTARNPYPMPFLLSAQAFAERAVRAIDAAAAGGASRRVIPWQMAVVARVLPLLPDALFDRLFARRGRKPRRSD